MSISIPLAKALEKAHYRNQKGIYFSGMRVAKGAVLLHSDIIHDCFWNYATEINTTSEKTDELIQEIILFYRRKRRQPCIYLTPFSNPVDMSKHLEARGFRLHHKGEWMVQEREISPVKRPRDLIVRRVKSDTEMEMFIKVFYEAFGRTSDDEPHGQLPPTYAEALRLSFRNPPGGTSVINYLGLLNEEPAGIGTLVSSDGFGGIYNVATSPKHQRRGIGSLISVTAVEDSRRGGSTLTYLITEDGSHLRQFYGKLGFTTKFVGCGYVLPEPPRERGE